MNIFTRPMVLGALAFEGADLWAEDGAERFQHESPLECLLAMLDESLLFQTGGVVQWLKEHPTFVTIVAHRRQRVSESERAAWAKGMAEYPRELFAEQYGDFDDGSDGLSDSDTKELERRTRELIDWYVSKARVFVCERLRSFTFDSDDVLEVIQQCRPQWLKSGDKP